MNEKIAYVNDQNFNERILQGDIPVLVDFFGDDCGPCRLLGPLLEQLAEEYEGKVKVAKANIADNKERFLEYSIMSMPTMILFKDGKEVDTMVGLRSLEQLKEIVDDFV